MPLTKFSETDAALLAKAIAPLLADAVASRIKNALAFGDDGLSTPGEAADYLNLSESTLESWRAKGIGPPWVKTEARSVGYPIRGLKAYPRPGASVAA
jgi:hypothetical protein